MFCNNNGYFILLFSSVHSPPTSVLLWECGFTTKTQQRSLGDAHGWWMNGLVFVMTKCQSTRKRKSKSSSLIVHTIWIGHSWQENPPRIFGKRSHCYQMSRTSFVLIRGRGRVIIKMDNISCVLHPFTTIFYHKPPAATDRPIRHVTDRLRSQPSYLELAAASKSIASTSLLFPDCNSTPIHKRNVGGKVVNAHPMFSLLKNCFG